MDIIIESDFKECIKASFYPEIEVEDVGMYYSHDTGLFRMELKGEETDYHSDELFIDDAKTASERLCSTLENYDEKFGKRDKRPYTTSWYGIQEFFTLNFFGHMIETEYFPDGGFIYKGLGNDEAYLEDLKDFDMSLYEKYSVD